MMDFGDQPLDLDRSGWLLITIYTSGVEKRIGGCWRFGCKSKHAMEIKIFSDLELERPAAVQFRGGPIR